MLSTIWASKSSTDAVRKKHFINPEYIISFEIQQKKIYLKLCDGSTYIVHNKDDILEASRESKTMKKIYNEFVNQTETYKWVENEYDSNGISESQYDIPEEWYKT